MHTCSNCQQFIRLNEHICPFCQTTVRAPLKAALTLGMSLLLGVGLAQGCDDDKDNATEMTTGSDDSSAAGVTYGAAPPLEEPLPGWELAPDKGENGQDDLKTPDEDEDEEVDEVDEVEADEVEGAADGDRDEQVAANEDERGDNFEAVDANGERLELGEASPEAPD